MASTTETAASGYGFEIVLLHSTTQEFSRQDSKKVLGHSF